MHSITFAWIHDAVLLFRGLYVTYATALTLSDLIAGSSADGLGSGIKVAAVRCAPHISALRSVFLRYRLRDGQVIYWRCRPFMVPSFKLPEHPEFATHQRRPPNGVWPDRCQSCDRSWA
jgi:hypothetical protein